MVSSPILDVPAGKAVDEIAGNWCVLRTWGGREFPVAESLARTAFGYFLPATVRRRIYAKRTVDANVPVFPNYVFAAYQHEGELYDLSQVKYVSEVMRVPAWRQEDFVHELRGIQRVCETAAKNHLSLEADEFTPGRPVCVKSGPFLGLCGEVIVRRNREIIQVAITLLGQCITLDIDELAIESLN